MVCLIAKTVEVIVKLTRRVSLGAILIGLLLASYFACGNEEEDSDSVPATLTNKTRLEVGDEFPDLPVTDEDGHLVHLGRLLRDRRTILSFVSEGCEPCEDLLLFLQELDTGRIAVDQMILLAMDIESRSDAGGFELYQIDRRTLTGLGVDMFPTLVGIEKSGEISFVSSGFSRSLVDRVIEEEF